MELSVHRGLFFIDRAGGVTVKVRAIVQQKFTDLLHANGGGKVERTNGESEGDQGNTGGGNTDENLEG